MYYTVIVVDDEEDQRRALIERVKWEAAGFRVIGEAENGVEALDVVEALEPDLVLTDIKMPLMTGLELAAKVREIRPATQMVILSGYDKFEYAQTAIQYNIISYLLKPISSEELSEQLFEIHERMDSFFDKIRAPEAGADENEKRLKLAEFLLPLLLSSAEDTPNEEMLRRKARELELIKPDEKPFFGVLASKFKDTEQNRCTSERHVGFVNGILRKYVSCESFFVNGRIVTLVITDSPDFADIMQLPLRELVQNARRVLGHSCTVGASNAVSSISMCGSACFQALTARRYTADGVGEVRFIGDQEHGSVSEFEYIEKSVFKLEQLLKVGTKHEIEQFLEELYSAEKRESMDYMVIQILATVYRTVDSVCDKDALAELVGANPIYAKAAVYGYREGIRQDITELCISANEIISRNRKRDTEVLCDRVLQIIDEEFANENLSLADISARLNVSPNYLSTLIKKTKKKNFINLLTERRMKMAYDMLTCSSMKILEVAERCGYSDQHYFSYCFKKYYGTSPNRARGAGREEQQ